MMGNLFSLKMIRRDVATFGQHQSVLVNIFLFSRDHPDPLAEFLETALLTNEEWHVQVECSFF